MQMVGDVAGTRAPSARPARLCWPSASDLQCFRGRLAFQPANVRFALLRIPYASQQFALSLVLAAQQLAVVTVSSLHADGDDRLWPGGRLWRLGRRLLRSASEHAGSAALWRPRAVGEDPSASTVASSWSSLRLRLTLRCSGRQPGVRPVAAAELKYR